MRHIFSYILLPVIAMMVVLGGVAEAQPKSSESMIRVGLYSEKENIMISGTANFELQDADTGKKLARFSANARVNISDDGTYIRINSKPIRTTRLHIITTQNDEEKFITVNGSSYRGDIDIHLTHGKKGLTVVNHLPVDQYLYGVVGKEISSNWPLEAMKAQAVAARTYALGHLDKFKEDDYDVCATIACQVYGGQSSETARIIECVDATAGQVILYEGKLIDASFHSSSGGYTENSENVWGTYLPYLRGVADYDQNSPQYKWDKSITMPELENALSQAGYPIGTIQMIKLTPLTKQPINSVDRGISGRVKVVQFIGSTGSTELTGEKLRKLFGLKSTLFDLTVISTEQKFTATDHRILSQHEVKGARGVHYISGNPNETILISGFGWGHGLGLSQWGAKTMAEQGPQNDATYYQEILKHYYQGTNIKKVF